MATKICILGAGNMGTAMARILCDNVKQESQFCDTVTMWLHYEEVDGKSLAQIINETHDNVKYLPGVSIPENLVATSDLVSAAKEADVFVFIMPHQFIKGVCKDMKPYIKPTAFGVSLVKSRAVYMPSYSEDEGLEVLPGGGIRLVSQMIQEELGIPIHVLLGANLARDIVKDMFCEATIGAENKEQGELLKQMFQTDSFRIRIATDARTVELCSALKNIVACGAGFTDGLGMGDNTKAAVIRLGLMEIMRFVELFHPGSHLATFFESSGIGNLITTCYAGRHRSVSALFAKHGGEKRLRELEQEHLHGSYLQGPHTAEQVFLMLQRKHMEDKFPLFVAIHKIFQHEMKPAEMVDCLRHHPEHTDYYKLVKGVAKTP